MRVIGNISAGPRNPASNSTLRVCTVLSQSILQIAYFWAWFGGDKPTYVDTALPFGLCSTPKIFTAVAGTLQCILEKEGWSITWKISFCLEHQVSLTV